MPASPCELPHPAQERGVAVAGPAVKITSTEFQQNVGRYQDAAMKEPVTITKNGRDHTVLVSADFFNAVLKGRLARRVEELDDETIKAIASAEVPAMLHHDPNRKRM
jgi:prevent-host-death family protein